LDGTGHVKVVVEAPYAGSVYENRIFVILKNGVEILELYPESR